MELGKVRIDNINRVHMLWKLRHQGLNLESMIQASKTKQEFIQFVISHTDHTWYVKPVSKASYFDKNNYWIQLSKLKNDDIEKMNNSLILQKKIFHNMIIVTILLVLIIIFV